MSENPEVRNKSRRRLLKSLAAGSGAVGTAALLPEKWTKPVVDAVVVPLHAQVSPVLNPPALAGTWRGQWNNTTFASTGAITAIITVDAQAQTFVVVLDLDGSVFGGSNPPADTFNGTYTVAGGAFGGISAVLGNVNYTISPTGVLNGTFANPPASGINNEVMTGTLTPQTIAINFTINFSNSTTAIGVANLQKQ